LGQSERKTAGGFRDPVNEIRDAGGIETMGDTLR